MVLRQFGLGVVTCRGHCGNRDVCTELLALPNHTAWGTKLVNSGMSGLPTTSGVVWLALSLCQGKKNMGTALLLCTSQLVGRAEHVPSKKKN